MTYGQQPKLKLTYRYFWLWLILEYAKPDTYASRAAKIILYFFGYKKNINGFFFHPKNRLALSDGFIEIRPVSADTLRLKNPIIYRARNKGVTSVFLAAIQAK